MQYYYNENDRAFYVDTVHDSIPENSIPVSSEEYAELQRGLSEGKIISVIEGVPTLVDNPGLPAPEELRELEIKSERDRRIQAVRWRIERHNDEIALGMTPTEPLEPLLTYVQALRDMPQLPGFPWADGDVPWPVLPAEPV